MDINRKEEGMYYVPKNYYWSPNTGSTSISDDYRLIFKNFENFRVGIVVDSDNKFIGIAEISQKRDFLSTIQRISKTSSIDVDTLYKE